jgi:FkbM family methyltransferase
MTKLIWANIRKVFKIFGIEISRFSPAAVPLAQLLESMRLMNANIVFDIGANTGQFASELRSHGYKGKIVSIEPLSSARKLLLQSAIDDKQWDVYDQVVVGDHEGKIEINIAGNSVSSSVLPILDTHTSAEQGSSYIGKETVVITTLDTIVSHYIVSDISIFVKIDTQGFEWQVLEGARETLKLANGVLCELSLVPLYEGQKLWREIIDRLEGEGFTLWAIQKGFTHPQNGRTLQIDAIFLRLR